jgi:hypothetical protein
LHERNNLASFRRFRTTGRADTRKLNGGVRAYANGRIRSVVTLSKTQALAVTFVLVTEDDLDWLDARTGATLLFRDYLTRMLYGSYYGLDVTDHHDRTHDVTISFLKLTVPFGIAA